MRWQRLLSDRRGSWTTHHHPSRKEYQATHTLQILPRMKQPSQKLSEGEFVGYYGKVAEDRNEWAVYRVSDGTLVAYRTIPEKGKKTDIIERIVTQATNMVELSLYLDKPRRPRTRQPKVTQLRID